jgi:hypothetical protein
MRHLALAFLLCGFAGVAGAADAPPPSKDAADAPCRTTAGAKKAKALVEQSLEVSPATHPPCNAANACSLITDEIARGCAMIEKDAPAFCADYAKH